MPETSPRALGFGFLPANSLRAPQPARHDAKLKLCKAYLGEWRNGRKIKHALNKGSKYQGCWDESIQKAQSIVVHGRHKITYIQQASRSHITACNRKPRCSTGVQNQQMQQSAIHGSIQAKLPKVIMNPTPALVQAHQKNPTSAGRRHGAKCITSLVPSTSSAQQQGRSFCSANRSRQSLSQPTHLFQRAVQTKAVSQRMQEPDYTTQNPNSQT